MEIIFLGTATSQGVPLVAHDNKEIDLKNPKNWRTRSSIHVVMDGFHIQVDAGPEFRLQCLYNQVNKIDAFILTHEHADHIMGMDDLRRFCETSPTGKLNIYSSKAAMKVIEIIFPYALTDKPLSPGYPCFVSNEMPEVLETPGGWIYSTLLPHGKIETLGLVFVEKSSGKKVVYYNDCKTVTSKGMELAQGADVVILDGLRHEVHHSHMTISEATAVAQKIGAKQSYLTHIAYMIDHERDGKQLPTGVEFAYDGLRVNL